MWSNIQPDGKVTEFFKKKSPEETKTKFECVNCEKYATESLRELNEHLDICLRLLTKSPPPKKFVINLDEDDDEM